MAHKTRSLFYPEARGQLRAHRALSLIVQLPSNSFLNSKDGSRRPTPLTAVLVYLMTDDLVAEKIMLMI